MKSYNEMYVRFGELHEISDDTEEHNHGRKEKQIISMYTSNGHSKSTCHHKVSKTTQNMKFTAHHSQSVHLKPRHKSREIDGQN